MKHTFIALMLVLGCVGPDAAAIDEQAGIMPNGIMPNGALEKCAALGYSGRELTACARALRADYCGDGTSYTIDGTLVNLYDASGVQLDEVDWAPEAEWSPDGALCISKKTEARFWQVLRARPPCYPLRLKADKACGSSFARGALIITELAPR